MKRCTICKQEKPETEFNKKSGSNDGLQNKCRECSKTCGRNHYRSDPGYYLERNKRRRQEIREWLLSYKQQLKCNRCGEDRLPCIEFHHTDPTEKDFCISAAIKRGFCVERLQKEIAKCEVLCANCHAIEHWHGSNWLVV